MDKDQTRDPWALRANNHEMRQLANRLTSQIQNPGISIVYSL